MQACQIGAESAFRDDHSVTISTSSCRIFMRITFIVEKNFFHSLLLTFKAVKTIKKTL